MTFDYIDLNNDDWYVLRSSQLDLHLGPSRVVKLISARDRSQSLDTVTLEDSCGMLKEEHSGLSISLRSFSFGSTFQIAVEALVFNTSEVEKEEEKLLSEIAMETRRLEELELEVTSSYASQHQWLRLESKIQTAKSRVKWRKEAMDDQCDLS